MQNQDCSIYKNVHNNSPKGRWPVIRDLLIKQKTQPNTTEEMISLFDIATSQNFFYFGNCS